MEGSRIDWRRIEGSRIEGSRFPHGLPRTIDLLVILAAVVAFGVALHLRRFGRIVIQQMTAWASRAGS